MFEYVANAKPENYYSEVSLSIYLETTSAAPKVFFEDISHKELPNYWQNQFGDGIYTYTSAPGKAMLHRCLRRYMATSGFVGHRTNSIVWGTSRQFCEKSKYFGRSCVECIMKHGNLETLHITGFVGIREADVEIVIYVLETHADSINKIVIDFPSLTRKQTESLNVEEMPMARKGFLMLKEKVPPHVQLLLHP